MNRRRILRWAGASFLLTGIPTRSHAAYHRDKFSSALLRATLLLALKDEAGARREALQLKVLSQIDPKWTNYGESFRLALILLATTPPNDRAALIEANSLVVKAFPGTTDALDYRTSLRLVASSAEYLLQAESPTPRYHSRDYMGEVAGLLLSLAGVTTGSDRTRWAQTAQAGLRRFGDRTLKTWSFDEVTTRMLAAGVAASGNWAEAITRYGELLRRGEGSMNTKIKPASAGGNLGGLRGLIAGVTVFEAEAATAYAMGGQIPRALELLEQSRRDAPSGQRPYAGPTAAAVLEGQLLAEGAVLVQPVSSLIGAFALVSIRRGGRVQRFTSLELAPGGLELVYRVLDANTKFLRRDGLIPAYLSARRSSGDGGREKMQQYVVRAARDADLLIGSAIRKALDRAKASSKDDVLVILPGNLAMLPIGASTPGEGIPTLAESYQLRFAESLKVAWTAQSRARARGSAIPSAAALTGAPARVLRYLPFEVSSVLSAFPAMGRRRIDETTAAEGLAAFGEATHWHLASHSSLDFKRPERSGIAIGKRRVLTVNEVLGTNLEPSPRLVFLSACETAFPDLKQEVNRFISLPSAFMAAGATAVVGSLWPVSDAATSLLAARFYDEHQTGKQLPAAALRRAQTWLGHATPPQLQDYVTGKVAQRQITLPEAASISSWLASLDPIPPPYAHPYYWAGFQAYGR